MEFKKIFTAFMLALLLGASPLWADPLPDGPAGTPAVVSDNEADAIEEQLAREAKAEKGERGKLVAEVKVQRGFYIATDIGFFLTFAGQRGHSNVQPYIGFNLGYDFNKWLSLQLSVANGFNSNNAPGQQDNRSTFPNAIPSYQLTNLGLQLVGMFMPHERVGLELKLGGGTSRISPLPRSLRKEPNQESGWQGHIAAGFGVKYITLLTDFTAGLDISFYFVLPAKIPALAITPTVRYTF